MGPCRPGAQGQIRQTVARQPFQEDSKTSLPSRRVNTTAQPCLRTAGSLFGVKCFRHLQKPRTLLPLLPLDSTCLLSERTAFFLVFLTALFSFLFQTSCLSLPALDIDWP